MFKFVFLCPRRWFQFNCRIVRTHFWNIMTLNNWKMIAETRTDIFRWRSRFHRRRVCLSPLIAKQVIWRRGKTTTTAKCTNMKKIPLQSESVQNYCFSLSDMQICDFLVAIVVLVPKYHCHFGSWDVSLPHVFSAFFACLLLFCFVFLSRTAFRLS